MRSIGRTIAIGDIHGCAHALDAVLDTIQPRHDDLIICLGDVIDSGRDTAAAIERLLKLQHECRLVCLMGNHEEMLLGALENEQLRESWFMLGGIDTLNSYRFGAGIDVIPREHIEFIRSFRDSYETADHVFVHANYEPDLPLAQQPVHTLRWSLLDDPHPRPHCSGKKVIVGHTEQKSGEILDLGSVICIDTYCRAYGWLTALEVETGQVWQASRWGSLRQEGETIDGLVQARALLKKPEM